MATRLLRLWVRIPSGGMDVCYECCVLSDRGLCERADHLSRGVLPTVVRRCDLKTCGMRWPWPTGGVEGGLLRQKQDYTSNGPQLPIFALLVMAD